MKYLYELIGTFFLVLTIGMTVLGTADIGNFAPLAIGSVLAVMVYAGAHISGAHYNPAVTLAVFMQGKLSGIDLAIYWISQLLGAVLAAVATLYFEPEMTTVVPKILDISRAFFAEFLFTFALCFVALNVAVAKATRGNSYFGFAIGFVVVAGAYAVGSISGAAFNPVVAVGQAILGLTFWSNLWMYVAATMLGAAASAWVFKKVHPIV